MIMCEHMHANILIMEYFLMLDSLYNFSSKDQIESCYQTADVNVSKPSF